MGLGDSQVVIPGHSQRPGSMSRHSRRAGALLLGARKSWGAGRTRSVSLGFEVSQPVRPGTSVRLGRLWSQERNYRRTPVMGQSMWDISPTTADILGSVPAWASGPGH